MRSHTAKQVALLIALALIAGVSSWSSASADEVRITPQDIAITAFFNGASVKFTGRIPQGASAVLEVRGPEHDEQLMRKGRRGGLWMNVGELTVKNAPSVYLCMSTDKDVLSTAENEVPWGYETLGKHIQWSRSLSGPEQTELLQQFLKLKENDGLYAILPASLSVTQGTDGRSTVQGRLDLPARIPPGDYEVHLYGVTGKQVTSNHTGRLHVATEGFPALLDELAMQHSLSYGLLAVVIAIVAGFGTGYLFTSKGAH